MPSSQSYARSRVLERIFQTFLSIALEPPTPGTTDEPRERNRVTMNYFEITAKCEEVNESSYTIQSTGEVVTKIQLSLVVPSMRDRVLCEIPLEKAPTTDQLSTWELDESWLVVSAEGMRALAVERSSARAGETPVGALVVFQAVAVR